MPPPRDNPKSDRPRVCRGHASRQGCPCQIYRDSLPSDGRESPRGGGSRRANSSGHGHFDVLGRFFLALGEVDFQHTVPEVGRDLVGGGIFRQ